MKPITIIAICVICAATLMSGCVESPEYGDGANIGGSNDLIILEHHQTTGDFGILIIEGTAENTGTRSLVYAEIRAKFYDADGVLVDTSIDNINDLGPCEKWNFNVVYLGLDTERLDSYSIAVGTTF